MKKVLTVAVCMAGAGFALGWFARGSSVDTGTIPMPKNSIPSAFFLGATLAQCQSICIGIETNTGRSLIDGGYTCNLSLSGADETVDEIGFQKCDGSAFTGYEVDYLLECSGNGFEWLVYPFGGGRWHRNDNGAFANLWGTTNLVVSREKPSWW